MTSDVGARPGRWRLGLTNRDLSWLGGMLCLGLVLRVVYLLATGSKRLHSDAVSYFAIAANVTKGRGFSDQFPGLFIHATAFRPPGYPLLLAGVFSITGPSPGVARWLNLVLGLMVIALVFLLVRRQVSLLAATVAAGAVAIMPNLIANDVNVLSDPLSLCLLLGVLLCILSKRWWAVGVFLGLLALTRPSAQVFILGVALWVVTTARWKPLGKVALAGALVVSPWFIRNWVEFGSPTYVTSNGFNWAAVYSEPAQANGRFTDPVYDPAWDHERILQLDEAAWSRQLQTEGIDGLKANPGYVFHVLQQNVRGYFELAPSFNDSAENEDGRIVKAVRWTLPIFYLELCLGLGGLILAWRTRLAKLALLTAVTFASTSLLFVQAPRLRAPFDLMLGIGCGLLAQWARERQATRRANPALQSSSPASTAN